MSSTDAFADTAEHHLDANILHHALIEKLEANGHLKSPRIAAAFHAVPRQLFLPGVPLDKVYSDQAIPTKVENDQVVSSSSQPAMMAIMLEQLDLRAGDNVLEIGAGTGYNAALMAYLVGSGGQVTSLEIDPDLAKSAEKHLREAGCDQVQVVSADGVDGCEANGPYDRIILTAGGWDIMPAWLSQLKPDGMILLPLSINGPQISAAFRRQEDCLTTVSTAPCGFMRMRGSSEELQRSYELGPEPGLLLEINGQQPAVDANAAYRWLTGPVRHYQTGVRVTIREAWSGLGLWHALHESYRCFLVAQHDIVDREIVPYLFGSDGDFRVRMTMAHLGEQGIAALAPPPDRPAPLAQSAETGETPPPFEIYIRYYGAQPAAQRLLELVRDWAQMGRPGTDGLRIRAYPVEADCQPGAGTLLVRKRWHQFAFDWPAPSVSAASSLRI